LESKTGVLYCCNAAAILCRIFTRRIADARGRDLPNRTIISRRPARKIAEAAIVHFPNRTIISRIIASSRSITPVNYHANVCIKTSLVPKTTHVIFTNFAREIVTRIQSDTALLIARFFTGFTLSGAIDTAIVTLNRFPRTCRSKTPAAGGTFLTKQNSSIELGLGFRSSDIRIIWFDPLREGA